MERHKILGDKVALDRRRGTAQSSVPVETLDEDALLAELEDITPSSDITELHQVRTTANKRAAEEIAIRTPRPDFNRFKPPLESVQRDLHHGARTTRQIRKDAGFLKADVKVGDFFILYGQTAYIAEIGEPIKAPNGETDARLRVIYWNGTESDLPLRSLQRALYKVETSRRISEQSAGPLFSGESDVDDLASGTIYVLRSKSDHPLIASNRDVLHKIDRRRCVATYELYNINRTKLENLIQRVFDPVRLDIEIKDRFGNPIVPREWFLVPRFVVDYLVERIKDGTITQYIYDPQTARLVN